jgi:hypothetical protein
MLTQDTVIEKIEATFAGNAFPGARFLQGSFEGCEPYDEVDPFEKLERARRAPPDQNFRQHIAEQEEYLAVIRPDNEDGTDRP